MRPERVLPGGGGAEQRPPAADDFRREEGLLLLEVEACAVVSGAFDLDFINPADNLQLNVVHTEESLRTARRTVPCELAVEPDPVRIGSGEPEPGSVPALPAERTGKHKLFVECARISLVPYRPGAAEARAGVLFSGAAPSSSRYRDSRDNRQNRFFHLFSCGFDFNQRMTTANPAEPHLT